MADFEIAYQLTLGVEGDFGNDPDDPGGETRYGITEKVARKYGYKGEMRDLPIELAHKIYREGYWEKLSLDLVDDQAIADFLFDAAVNCGTIRGGGWKPSLWLQEDLNALNKCGKLWPDIKEDGHIGIVTLGILNRALHAVGMRDRILKLLVADRTIYYKELARKKEKFERFLGGWLDNRCNLPK